MRLAHRVFTALTVAAMVVLLAGAWLLADMAGLRYDATRGKRHSLSRETNAVLDALSRDVHVLAFFRPAAPGRKRAGDLLELYEGASDRFSYEFVDPDRELFRARERGVTRDATMVFISGDKQEKVVSMDEESLTTALVRVTSQRTMRLGLVTGHGELDLAVRGEEGVSRIMDELSQRGVETRSLSLVEEGGVPEAIDLVCVLGPSRDFLEPELKALTGYFTSGGEILVALKAEARTNLDAWLEEYAGLRRMTGYVMDPVSRFVTGDYLSPVIQDYSAHSITRDFSLMTIMPTAAALEPLDEGGALHVLGRSTPEAWLESDVAELKKGRTGYDQGEDTPGPLWLAAVHDPSLAGNEAGSGRLAAFADQDFLTDRYSGVPGNTDLAMNTINWLLSRDNLITITKPEAAGSFLHLRPAQRWALFIVPLAVVPGTVVVLAVWVWTRRRRQQQGG